MIRVTFVEAITLQPTFTAPDAPLWTNATGEVFRVASELRATLPDGAWSPDSDSPVPIPGSDRPTILAGVDGHVALAMLGLHPA